MEQISEDRFFIRICNYRHCNNELIYKRSDAKFCSTSCRKMEQTYRKRKDKLIQKWKQNEAKKVESYKNFIEIVQGGIQK